MSVAGARFCQWWRHENVGRDHDTWRCVTLAIAVNAAAYGSARSQTELRRAAGGAGR